MDLKEQYLLSYQFQPISPKKYLNFQRKDGGLNIKYSKKKTFVADIEKLAKQYPGVGKYIINPQKSVKSKLKQDKRKNKGSFIDDIIKSHSFIPAVGKYQLVTDNNLEIKKKYASINDRIHKQTPIFKQNVLDPINTGYTNVGPGLYQQMQTLGRYSRKSSILPEHKHVQSLNKMPSAHNYRPIPVDYQTFDLKAQSVKKKSYNSLTKQDNNIMIKESSLQGRSSQNNDGVLSPGPKYSLIADWKGNKEGSNGRQNMFLCCISSNPVSVYH